MNKTKNLLLLFFCSFQIAGLIGFSEGILSRLKYFNYIPEAIAETHRDYLLKASFKKDIGDFEGAILDLNKALKINPNYVEAYLYRGSIYVAIKNFEKAIDDLTFVVESKTTTSMESLGYERRGISKFFIEDYEGAAKDLLKALKINPKEFPTSSYKVLALSKMKTMNYISAISYFNKALNVEPNSYYLYEQRGIAKFKSNLKGYCDDWNKATEIGSEISKKLISKFCN